MTKRILALDPSGTGTTGIALMENDQVTFKEFTSSEWKEHWRQITDLLKDFQPKVVLYESTNYIHSRGKDMTSLFKLLGGLECLGHSESIPVNQVKGLKQKLLKGTKTIPNLAYSVGRGKGWIYAGQRISVHCLEAYLVYYLWKS